MDRAWVFDPQRAGHGALGGADILVCRILGSEECLRANALAASLLDVSLAECLFDESLADKNFCPTRQDAQAPVGTPGNRAATAG
jgi:hypothetical protein